ncbi:hypothetical protein G7Y89_g1470 [Cudoniella acicularis]|uniref:Uncharacterized protein n=1 Tax=Cudoniella acicularis TaxID=354080 RepID=A0A8H4RY43_9HELO|nr:hypothetical protein G7Y89_g1470 [Cudoniella acicularis]
MGVIQRALLLAIGLDVVAAVVPNITTTSTGVDVECKSCPYDLCTNVKAYSRFDTNITVSCWTHGQNVAGQDGDRIWLGTPDKCYVAQYNLDYNGTAQSDLAYCGEESSARFFTTQPSKTRYDTECNINPDYRSDTSKYYPNDVDLTLTCWTKDETNFYSEVIGNLYWYKTNDNCYSSETGFWGVPDRDALDNCGAIADLELNTTSGDGLKRPKTTKPKPKKPVTLRVGKEKRYLRQDSIESDHAFCRELPTVNSSIVLTYPANHTITAQCTIETTDVTEYPASGTWDLTTDFCYVAEDDLWDAPSSYFKFPACEQFGQISKNFWGDSDRRQ